MEFPSKNHEFIQQSFLNTEPLLGYHFTESINHLEVFMPVGRLMSCFRSQQGPAILDHIRHVVRFPHDAQQNVPRGFNLHITIYWEFINLDCSVEHT